MFIHMWHTTPQDNRTNHKNHHPWIENKNSTQLMMNLFSWKRFENSIWLLFWRAGCYWTLPFVAFALQHFCGMHKSGPDMQYPNSRGNRALAYKCPTTPFEDGTVSKSIFPPKLAQTHFWILICFKYISEIL